MIIVDSALAKREAEGRPIRVGLVGAGFMGTAIARKIMHWTKGIRLAAIAARRPEAGLKVFRDNGRDPRECATTAEIEAAIDAGTPVVTADAFAMARAGNIDVVFEITGSIDFAASVIIAAIDAGKCVVHMNAELDGTVGPILKRRADKAGVIYTFADGDQPGTELNLYRFVEGIGLKPVLCGNIKGLHDPYRNPTTQEGFARKWNQKPARVASFADGTKISYEQAVVANATGMKVAKRGMLGFDFSDGDVTRPLVPLEDHVQVFNDFLDQHLAAGGPGVVDYVVGARPGPGIFVLGTIDDPAQQNFLKLFKMGEGPYYCFTTQTHLCHFEATSSIGRAVIFDDPTCAPIAGPEVGVIAVAKKNLSAGDTIVDFGGYEVYGVLENIEVIRREGLLPIGIALDCKVRHGVAKDAPLRYADVILPEGRFVDKLYAEQEDVFAEGLRAAS